MRFDGEPVIAVAAIVAIEQRGAAAVGDDDIEVAIVVEIGDGGAAATCLMRNAGPLSADTSLNLPPPMFS